jgi:hypothetical protein
MSVMVKKQGAGKKDMLSGMAVPCTLSDEDLVAIWQSLRPGLASDMLQDLRNEVAQQVIDELLQRQADGDLPPNPRAWAKTRAWGLWREFYKPDQRRTPEGRKERFRREESLEALVESGLEATTTEEGDEAVLLRPSGWPKPVSETERWDVVCLAIAQSRSRYTAPVVDAVMDDLPIDRKVKHDVLRALRRDVLALEADAKAKEEARRVAEQLFRKR